MNKVDYMREIDGIKARSRPHIRHRTKIIVGGGFAVCIMALTDIPDIMYTYEVVVSPIIRAITQ